MAKTATYSLIESQTAGSAVASVTFSSIPATFTDLVLVTNVRSTRSAADDSLYMRLNSDTATNYSYTELKGNGTTVTSNRQSSISSFYAAQNVAAASQASGTFTPVLFNLNDYSNATTHKTILARNSFAGGEVSAEVGLWRSTSAITTIQVYCAIGNLATGSTFKLYGIEAYK